ncbi:hypothetical protein AMTRI_Chr03g48500 [Amborella trichopoda]
MLPWPPLFDPKNQHSFSLHKSRPWPATLLSALPSPEHLSSLSNNSCMAQPFPANSSFPSLIDFGDENNNNTHPSLEESLVQQWRSDQPPRSLRDRHSRPRPPNPSSRSSTDSPEFGHSGAGSLPEFAEPREFRHGSEESVPPRRSSPQSTLDAFLSSPHPTPQPILPSIPDRGDDPPFRRHVRSGFVEDFPAVAENAGLSSPEKPGSRSHGDDNRSSLSSLSDEFSETLQFPDAPSCQASGFNSVSQFPDPPSSQTSGFSSSIPPFSADQSSQPSGFSPNYSFSPPASHSDSFEPHLSGFKQTNYFSEPTFVAARDGYQQSEDDEKNDEKLHEVGDIIAPLAPSRHRKTSSYTQQSGQVFDSFPQVKRNPIRKHSLDERIPKHLTPLYHSKTEGCRISDDYWGGERLDFMSQSERIGSENPSSSPKSLPEFIGSGGGQGIFKVPLRAAIHPGRPTSLELRPHPLRETQVGCFLRTISCGENQLWAGQESGVRYWNFDDFFMGSSERCHVRGDEDTAPFHESANTSPTLCLLTDAANQLVLSGHKDGKIRVWKMDQDSVAGQFKECLSWTAHKTPVLSMVMTSYGDVWSGSEGGAIRAWPWEAMEKALALSAEERHIAVISMERSFIDLKNLFTVGGVCAIPMSDVRYLVSDYSRAKVWSGGYLSFALWDARTRDLLKVFGVDGQAEVRVDISSAQESTLEDEMKVKFVSVAKKEKTQGSLSFFQRSRNALMGAADAVRRVAVKGTFGDDSRRTEAIVASMDGMIWTGCANGALVQWDGNGNRLQEFHYHSSPVQCLCAFGMRLWIGYANGTIQVVDLEGKLLGGWVAHSCGVTKMVVGGGFVFTLASHGGIRAWNMTSPGPLDDILSTELALKELVYTKRETLKILVGTWNVGQERASHDSLIAWLGSSASDVGIVVVGLQEVEMGAGFLAMAAAKETVGLEGSANGQWWLDTIGKTLDEGATFERVGSRQLAGLLIAVWARKNLRPHVGDVDAAAVPCGFGRAIGNKGAVGLKMQVFHRIMCFVNCHFAAHLEAVNRRNADFDHVYRTMVFTRPSTAMNAVAAGVSSAVQLFRGANIVGSQPEEPKPELSEADMVVFLGDFNYRLHGISYDEARDFVSQRCFDWLREKDQLRAEMKAGKVFQGLREGHIRFPPTYKFERHQAGFQGYDSSEKKRIPAWCDRILFRDSRTTSLTQCSLECPVVSSISRYDACMEVTDSDHKPVRCIFNIDIAHVDKWVRRKEFGDIMTYNERITSLLRDLNEVPETIVSTNNMILQYQDTSILRLTNKCGTSMALFEVICEGQSNIKDDGFASQHHPRGAFGLPRWLEVTPAVGLIKPGQIVEISVHHEEFHTQEEFVDGVPQNWWCEDTRDKEVIILINVRACYSIESRSHRIRVRHCFSSKASRADSRANSNRAQQPSNHLHRADFKHHGSNSDVVDDFQNLHRL